MHLCRQCEKVAQTVVKWDSARDHISLEGTQNDGGSVELEHHTNTDTFREALNSGCWMCNVAWKTEHAQANENATPDFVPKVFGSSYPDGVELEFHARAEPVHFFFRARSELAYSSDPESPGYGDDIRPGPVYHGRLIDLGHDMHSSDQWRLIEVGAEGLEHYTYTTLSHRWASHEPLMLNATTKARMVRGMSISEMPVNYQDAVRITKVLNIRYLWIDTLCVFQDNELDIQEAACNMAVVYSGSACNIAVMTNQSNGMLSEGPKDPKDVMTYCKYESLTEKCYKIWHDSVWHREVATMPLYKRGWIAQEQILPSRQLLCGSKRLFWSCRYRYKYQTYAENLWQGTSSLGWAKQMRLARMLDPGNEWYSSGTYWFTFVNQYTQRDLTNAQDKLLAVSGIAKFLQSKTLGLYMAGLWESALPDSLLWQDEKPAAGSGLPIAYRAPSWSWASVEGIISYTPPELVVAQYLEAWVQTKNGSPFGFVTPNAYMEVRGPLFLLARNGPSGNEYFSLVGFEDYPITVELDHRSRFHEMLPYYHLLLIDIEKTHVKYGFRGLLLQRVKPSRSLGKNYCDVKSSVLKNPTEAQREYQRRPLGPSMYERIGLVNASTSMEFTVDGCPVERSGPGQRPINKSTLFGSMLNSVRTSQGYEPVAQWNSLSTPGDQQLGPYRKDIVII